MELSEGKAALGEIRELERRLDLRLKDAKQEAAKIIQDASAKALATVREKEARIETLKIPEVLPVENAAKTTDTFVPDGKFADDMARELLQIIRKN
jgi:vacuolar-type H+-ATPase subunit H